MNYVDFGFAGGVRRHAASNPDFSENQFLIQNRTSVSRLPSRGSFFSKKHTPGFWGRVLLISLISENEKDAERDLEKGPPSISWTHLVTKTIPVPGIQNPNSIPQLRDTWPNLLNTNELRITSLISK